MAGGTTPPIPNNAKNFDLEDKIRFVELAPSMQIRLETIRSDIEKTWGTGYFGKKFDKYGILTTSDTSDTKNAVTSNSKKNEIDQKYDSSTISADRDDANTWNISGIWKSIEQLWGTPQTNDNHFASPPNGDPAYGINPIWNAITQIWGDPTGSHDHFSGKPNGDSSKGINPIWDKLDDHEARITALEADVAQLKSDVKDLQDDVDKLNSTPSGYNPVGSGSGGPGYSGGGGSGGGSGSFSGGTCGGGEDWGWIAINSIFGGFAIQFANFCTQDTDGMQGGIIKPGLHLNFPRPFKNNKYAITGSDVADGSNIDWCIGFSNRSTTGCDVLVRNAGKYGGVVIGSYIAMGRI